ncbi:MAG: hypothetical protein IT383_15665 [Deltaproteobacteria bacterium]|nr:hypothetical protein [Deltaproteobacteria bacterium]
MLALAVALALAAPAHSRSEGKSSFALRSDGRVAITITLGTVDLPELCNADFSVAERAREEEKLTRCLEQGLPHWLRLSADERGCPVAFSRWRERERTVVIEAQALCAELPRTLVIDWGLFTGSALDHVSVAVIEQPHAEPRLVMLSRRSSRFVLEVARPWWHWGVVGGALLAVAAGVAAWAWRRRAATRAATADRAPG